MPPTFTVNNLLVRQHCLAFFTPPLHSRVLISQSLLKHLREYPLSPFVVRWLVSRNLFRPVIAPTHSLILLVIARNNSSHIGLRRHASLDCIIFGRQSKSVPTNRVIAFVTLLTLKTNHDIAYRIAHGVANMNTCATWVIKHTHSDILSFWAIKIYLVGLVVVPPLLPLNFNIFWVISLHS